MDKEDVEGYLTLAVINVMQNTHKLLTQDCERMIKFNSLNTT